MYTEPLSHERLADIRRGPGAYRIWSTDGQLLAACSSVDDVKRKLKHFYQGVSEGKIEPGVDTEAYRYLTLKGFAERYPVELLRFNYELIASFANGPKPIVVCGEIRLLPCESTCFT